MSRSYSALLGLVLLIGLTACGKDENNADNSTSPYNNNPPNNQMANNQMENQAPNNTTENSGQNNQTPNTSTETPLAFEFVEIDLGDPVEALTEIRFIPGTDSDFLLARKNGEVLHYTLEGDKATRKGSFTIDGVVERSDCGLIGMEFDPDFLENKFVYFGYCRGLGQNRISRHQLDTSDLSSFDTAGATIIDVDTPDAEAHWHNVGSIAFDQDGVMWALFGENANMAAAQDNTLNAGALVRIIPNRDVDGDGYTIPEGNPFVGDEDASDAIYAYGLRSPWRGTIDQRGHFWVGDVGAATIEEVNIVTEAGQNFGWPNSEGPCTEDCDGQTDPLINWNREPDHPFVLDDEDVAATDRRAVWVGLAYKGGEDDKYEGKLSDKVLYGDFCGGWVRAASTDDAGKLTWDGHLGHLEGVVSWAQAPDGHAYVATYGNCKTFPYAPGNIYRAVLAK